jgi:type I restriction enzyme S subunit
METLISAVKKLVIADVVDFSDKKIQATKDVISSRSIKNDQGFETWLQAQGLAARGEVDRQTLREIFDAMDDDDK